jgi:transaldolase/glucose-6-phosphate isomerase
MSKAIEKLTDLGQSLWYDNIERRLIENGELERMVTEGEIRGLTSNPSIFNHAIARSNDYDPALVTMAWAGYPAAKIFEQLALEDIREAADLLRGVYDETEGDDGYVSLEVSPHLARDTKATVKEARRLWKLVQRPNLMIKIPATKEGLPAITEAIAAGLNINVTLIFSLKRYLEVIDAYLTGLEQRASSGEAIDQIASVASFFVSRIDTKVDHALEQIIRAENEQAAEAQELLGTIAIANAKMAYRAFKKEFSSQRFEKLQKKGARVQRPLWASTSTKNPAYPETMYVTELVGPQTVNTVPQNTLEAFKEAEPPTRTLDKQIRASQRALRTLAGLGISLEAITDELEVEGVEAFAEAFDALIRTIDSRRMDAIRQLGPLAEAVAARIELLEKDKVARRIHKPDPELWTKKKTGQKEIQNRMGWLKLPESSRKLVPELESFVEEIRATPYTHALLLGMGGSSLAPEVMSLMFGPSIARSGGGGLDLAILDSTEPSQVVEAVRRSPVETTLFIVSSKSGTTSEVHAFMEYFWEKAHHLLREKAADHFIAITDPGTPLEKIARERGFRKVFNADPEVGGRYSALSAFGLVPAALMGINIPRLLDRAMWMQAQCAAGVPAGRNPGLVLGAVLGVAAERGRDKLTFASDPALAPVGSWLEQLIAESSGKEGKGIIPVDGEILDSTRLYGKDRLFVYLRRSGMYADAAKALCQSDFPVLEFNIDSDYDLGAEFYRWEFATAVACTILGVNAFDQPNVQDSKTRTKAKIAYFKEHEEFDEAEPTWTYKGIKAYVSQALGNDFLDDTSNLHAVMDKFVRQGQPGEYYAINGYLPRNPGMEILMARMQSAIRNRTQLATTSGFGPRFLHSTGQLHKGGPNTGIFLVLTAEPEDDLEIPDQEISFATLVYGQALGDFEALDAQNRKVLRIHLPEHRTIHQVIEALEDY